MGKIDWRDVVARGARAIVWLWPAESKEWGRAFAAELAEIKGFFASIRWLIGGLLLLTRENVRSFSKRLAHPLGRGADAAEDEGWRFAAAHGGVAIRMPVVVSVSTHVLILFAVLLVSFGYARQTPLLVAFAPPLPPPAPKAPPEVTDARVFPNAMTLYSSLPLRKTDEEEPLRVYVADGIGINFMSLPDIGATYRLGNSEWKVWPGQALESFLVRRVLPEYPRGAGGRGAVSVFVEYLILQNGSVKVMRTSGVIPYTRAAQSAIEQWVYRPLEYENRPCEVVSRVEVRFDGEFVESR